MKKKNTKQEKTAVSNNLKINLLIIGITAISMFALTGCQDQMASVEPKSVDHPILAKEIKLETVPSQLASQVSLDNIDEEIPTTTPKHIGSNLRRTISSHNMFIPKSNLTKESWKETYDGVGVPLYKISF